MDLRKIVFICWFLRVTEKKKFIARFVFLVQRGFEWYAALYTLLKPSITNAQKEKKIYLTAFDTMWILRRRKKLPPKGIFARINFFNLREAGGADRQNRFGRGQRRSIKNFT